jgi:hypothetical protein
VVGVGTSVGVGDESESESEPESESESESVVTVRAVRLRVCSRRPSSRSAELLPKFVPLIVILTEARAYRAP